jgi:hypothetical protein
MFIGSAREFAQEKATIASCMSEAQVSQMWGSPHRIVASGAGSGGDSLKKNSYVWIYYDPYRVVFYKNGAVTYCIKSEG